ncbi:hypothetical protein A4R26_29515 [Niastella populi]|uniref:Uncharacterized protein n=1 Tax=Niastella populi TaxID=550983 RepID=A0A1V9EYI0_9BACT|nr:hypothetical protein A4R26_29515 [Niastella populi]
MERCAANESGMNTDSANEITPMPARPVKHIIGGAGSLPGDISLLNGLSIIFPQIRQIAEMYIHENSVRSIC